jgi:hypothetical protein
VERRSPALTSPFEALTDIMALSLSIVTWDDKFINIQVLG